MLKYSFVSEAYLSVDKREYETKSMFIQSESNSRMSDQDTFFHALSSKKLPRPINPFSPIASLISADAF